MNFMFRGVSQYISVTGIMTVLPVSMYQPVQTVQTVQQIPTNLNFQLQQQAANQGVEIPMVTVVGGDATNLQTVDSSVLHVKQEASMEELSEEDDNGQLNIQDGVHNTQSELHMLP